MHSKQNERVPITQVEALAQASKHGQNLSGGQVRNKNRDGTLRLHQRRKMACPLCQSVTQYLSTHLQRVHKFRKESDDYKDAMRNKRPYLGKKKEVKRVVKKSKTAKRKKRSLKKSPPPPSSDEELTKRRPLKILVDEADAELSDVSDSVFGDILPPTPVPPPPLLIPSPVVDEQQPTMQSDTDEDYIEEEEDDDESEEEFETLKAYYANAVGKTDREKYFIMFCDHLKNVIGGCKRERQAILHSQHVRRIHDYMDPDGKDKTFESLLQDGGLQVWKNWAKPQLDERKMRPGSVRSYLLSLAKFFEFVEDHVVNKVSGFPNIPDDVFNRARSVIKRFKNMSSSINKEYAHLKWQKRMREEANATPVSIIQEMMDTKPAMEVMRYLTRCYNNQPTEKMFLSIRDFLLARLEIENCQRPGPFETATLEEFQVAKKVDGKMVMNVSRHKTSKAGPAPITMSDNTYSNVKAYVQYVRCHFADEEEEALFVTREGKAFPSGSLGKRISSWWKRATGRDVTSTQLRKVGSTRSMQEDLQTQIAVQTLMTHRRTTAEEHYQILNKTKQAVKGHAAIAKSLGLQDTVPTVFPKESQGGQLLSPSNTRLTQDQLDDIDLLFSEQINTNAPLSMKEVCNVMSESVNFDGGGKSKTCEVCV